AVAVPVGQVDRLVGLAAARQQFDTLIHPRHAVINVGEIEPLLAAGDDYRFGAGGRATDERDDALHAFNLHVVATVNVAEPKDQIAQPVTLGVGVDERLAGDLAGRVGAFGKGEVGVGFLGDVAADVAIDLARTAEDHRQLILTAVFQ